MFHIFPVSLSTGCPNQSNNKILVCYVYNFLLMIWLYTELYLVKQENYSI